MRMPWGDNWQLRATALAGVIMVAPLWCVDAIAMPDYPAHLASFYLIAGGAQLSHFYHIQWAAIPNLGSELAVPIVGRLTGFAIAIKLFLSVAVAMWVAGPALIHRALYGRWGVAPLGAAFFAYNANFTWGFFNYYFASGLALVLFAGWIASADWNRTLRTVVFTIAGIVIYFCHLFGAALLLMMIGCYEAALWLRERPLSFPGAVNRLIPIVAIAAPVAVLLLLKPHGTGDTQIAFNFLDTWDDRFEAAIDRYFDHPNYFLIAALAVLLALASWKRKISFHPDLLVLIAVLALGTALAPEDAMGGWGVDLRLPAVLGAILFAAASIHLSARWLATVAAAFLVMMGFNAAALAGNWRYYDRQFHEFRTAVETLPKNQRMVTVLDGDAIGKASDQLYWHLAEYAIVDRGDFTSLMFTTMGQHVVQIDPPLQNIAAASAHQGSPPDVSELDDLAAGRIDGDTDIANVFPYLMHFQCKYDEVVLIHLNGKRSPVSDLLHLRHAGSFFSIYDIDHSSCQSK